jgi:predicted DNA-binding transcriptional regulator AlpA
VTASASKRPAPPRLALTVEEAAAAIGMSRDSFDRHVKPDLRLIRRGRLVLVPVHELEAWCARAAALTLEGQT